MSNYVLKTIMSLILNKIESILKIREESIKNMKKLLFTFLTLFVGVTVASASYNLPPADPTYLDQIGAENSTITIKTVPIDTLYENFCNNNEESYLCEEGALNEFEIIVIQTYLGSKYPILKTMRYYVEYDEPGVISLCINNYGTSLDLPACRNYNISFDNTYNEKTVSSTNNLAKTIEIEDKVADLDYINYIIKLNLEHANENTYALRAFPKLRKIIDKNSDIDFIPYLQFAGESDTSFAYGGVLGLVSDGTVYAVSNDIFLSVAWVVYADEDAEDFISSTEKRIKDYLDDSTITNVEIVERCEEDSGWNSCDPTDISSFITADTGLTGEYTSNMYSVYINGERVDAIWYIFIAKIDSSKIKKPVFDFNDGTTGILISTDSTLPLDTKINATKGTATNINGIVLPEGTLAYYDIKLFSKLTNKYIDQISSGALVYLPLTGNYTEGDKLNIYYIKDDGTIGATIEATIVKIDGTYYAKFSTTHFSTYAVGTKSTPAPVAVVAPAAVVAPVANPDTYDEVIKYTFIIFVSIACLGLGITTYRKTIKN